MKPKVIDVQRMREEEIRVQFSNGSVIVFTAEELLQLVRFREVPEVISSD